MRDREASFTAAWVATCRSLGATLPATARIAHDPLGVEFAGPVVGGLARAALRHPRVTGLLPLSSPIAKFVYYMQVRTRALDDALLEFVASGGRQIVLLGAGFDCRAVRFRTELAAARVFEVDHPATQAKKRAVIERVVGAAAGSGVIGYVPWHFERDPMSALSARLGEHGHDAARPTLTIWEGVTMYLHEAAIAASVAAIRAYSAPGSTLALTYFDRDRLDRPRLTARIAARFVAARGEPFRFGWRPEELPAWLEARGLSLVRDHDAAELARALLPPEHARRLSESTAHVAIARI